MYNDSIPSKNAYEHNRFLFKQSQTSPKFANLWPVFSFLILLLCLCCDELLCRLYLLHIHFFLKTDTLWELPTSFPNIITEWKKLSACTNCIWLWEEGITRRHFQKENCKLISCLRLGALHKLQHFPTLIISLRTTYRYTKYMPPLWLYKNIGL